MHFRNVQHTPNSATAGNQKNKSGELPQSSRRKNPKSNIQSKLMTPQHRKNKIAELEQWLRDNPNHANRTIIETDLRKLKEQQLGRTYERDTFDLRNHNFHSK